MPFSRWITPREVKVRFDTWFFVAEAPAGAEPACDGAECVDFRWIRPADALAAGERDEMMLVFPTIKHLEQLAAFGSVAEALASAPRARWWSRSSRAWWRATASATCCCPASPGTTEA